MTDGFQPDLELLNEAFASLVPHNRALGLSFVEVSLVPAIAVIRLPWNDRLAGDPDSGFLHGGAVTSLLDAACGASVFLKRQSPSPIATLDLRVDFLKPSLPHTDLVARAECFEVTRNVAFARAVAYHHDVADPIACAAATFMLHTKGKSVFELGLDWTGSP